METIQGYEILEKVAETRSFLILRGRKEGGTDSVIIESLRAEQP